MALHLRHMWPPTAIAFGLGLTAAWVGLLGYGLFKLVEFVVPKIKSGNQTSSADARQTSRATTSIDGNIATSTPSKNSCDIRSPHLGWKLAVSQWRNFHNRLMLRRFLRLSWCIDTKNRL